MLRLTGPSRCKDVPIRGRGWCDCAKELHERVQFGYAVAALYTAAVKVDSI